MDEDDFDFKAMLGTISDPIPVRHPLLESRVSGHGNSMTRLLTAVPPPSSAFSQPSRDRAGSGMITVRLRAASDMHQHGYISAEEKSLMKNLILSRNQRFKEEYSHAERTNNWANLQQMLRSGYFDGHLFSNQALMGDMEHAFGGLGTPPLWGGGGGAAAAAGSGGGDETSHRKRMADSTTPVPRVRKSNVTPALAAHQPAALLLAQQQQYQQQLMQQQHQQQHALAAAAAATSSSPADLDDDSANGDEDSEQVAKVRKNERERQRRLAVSSGFDELCAVLKLPQMSQKDKVSILRGAIDRIRELERRVHELEQGL